MLFDNGITVIETIGGLVGMIKKVVVVMFILSLIFVLACVPPKKPATADERERDIVRDLQEIERQLEETERANDSDIVNVSGLEDSDVNITIAASDGENTVEKKVLLVVKKKNVAPVIRGLTSRLAADEGDSVRLETDVVDLNDDLVTVTFSAPFDQNGQWKTDHTSAGEYDITVTASDGELASSFNATLVVANVNVPPEIVGLEDDIEINEGQNVTLDFKVDDLDGDTVELSISEPIGDDMFWATGYTDHGQYIVTVAASDGKDTVSKEINLVVHDVNVPPTILNVTRR